MKVRVFDRYVNRLSGIGFGITPETQRQVPSSATGRQVGGRIQDQLSHVGIRSVVIVQRLLLVQDRYVFFRRETPHITFVHRTVGLNLVDSPVICCAENKTLWIKKARKAHNHPGFDLVAFECTFSALINARIAGADVHVM